jgi:hypothetical protein
VLEPQSRHGKTPSNIGRVLLQKAEIVTEVQKSGIVVINGSGFLPNEPVYVTVENASAFRVRPRVVLAQWIVFADARGMVSASWQMADLGGSYKVALAGGSSDRRTGSYFNGPVASEVASANLDQCANGPLGSEVVCTGGAWENGNLNETKAHYFEGESVAYRLRLNGLSTTGTHSVSIEWDTTEQGKHAIDYVTSFDRSETDANPCSGVADCDPLVFNTFAIPEDLWVSQGHDGVLGTADDIPQIPGDFTIFNGSIISVTGYTRDGTFAGSSKTSIQIVFSATVPNPVIAWGGHISTRYDWGIGNSAIAISGSPFHTRLLDLDGSGGNQDRSLSSSAAVFPAIITIIKDSQPNSAWPFSFTATGQPGLASFILDDDGLPQVGYPNSHTFTNLAYFGSANAVVVTETIQGSIFSLSDVNCTSDPHGGSGTNNNTVSLAAGNVSITLEEGEIVTCTFVNLITGTTASDAYISGRVLTSTGRPISRAMITVTRPFNGEVYRVYTNTFGFYTVKRLPVGESYLVTVAARRYTFEQPSVLLNLYDNVEAFNFTALP